MTHLGLVVAVEDGVVVPVIRNVEQKGIAEIHTELGDLVSRARNGRLQPYEIKGSTFTVTNLGMFGIDRFTAILNAPEVGIMSVGCIIDKPVRVQGQMVFRPMIEATINVDHRAIDGAVAARFLQTLKDLLENPHFV